MIEGWSSLEIIEQKIARLRIIPRLAETVIGGD